MARLAGPTLDSGPYRWVAPSNTTLGVFEATIDTSNVLIALPDIFKGVHLNPLDPKIPFHLRWIVLGFMTVTSVLAVSFSRPGDTLGRVRVYKVRFAIYTFFSLLLSVTWMSGTSAV